MESPGFIYKRVLCGLQKGDVSFWDTYRLSCTSVQGERKGGACQSCACTQMTLVRLIPIHDSGRAVQGGTPPAFTVRVANLAGLCCRLPDADARTAMAGLQADAAIGMYYITNTRYCIGWSLTTYPEPVWPGGTALQCGSQACMRMFAQPWKSMTAHTLATFPDNTEYLQIEGCGQLALGRADC